MTLPGRPKSSSRATQRPFFGSTPLSLRPFFGSTPLSLRPFFGSTPLSLRLLSIAILVLVTLLATPAGAATTTSTSAPPKGFVTLLNQTDWNTGTNPFDLQVHVSTSLPVENTELDVTVFNQVRSRSQFQQSMQNKMSGSSIILERHPLTDVLQPDGTATVELPIQDAAQRRYYLKEPGIYPVRVELRTADTDTAISTFVTHLINEPPVTAPALPLGVSVVLPVQVAQSTDTKNPLATPDNGKPFETVSKTFNTHPQTPATMLVEPESVERLKDTGTEASTAAVDDLKNSMHGRDVAKTSWAPLPTALYSSDTMSEVGEQMARGSQVLNPDFNSTDSNDWIVTDQIDTNSLNELKTQGFSRVVVPEGDLSPQQRAMTLERPFAISTAKNKTATPAGMADQELSNHFTDPGGPILDAHQLLADLAVLWNDMPGQQRSVIVMPPRNWNPDPGFLETMFRGLSTSPVLQPQTLDQFFATPSEKSGGTTLLRSFAAPAKTASGTFPTGRVTDDRKRITGFSNFVNTDNVLLGQLQQQLLLAERVDIDQRTRDTALDNIKNSISHQLSLIQLPAERSIRLTARQGQIPISVQNDTGYEVHLTVELTSTKLAFPQGNTRVLDLARQHVTEAFAIDARTSGAFPLQVRLVSPDGQTVIQRSAITIRSTATSAIGVGLSIGAGVFLILWWMRSTIKTRRRKATQRIAQS